MDHDLTLIADAILTSSGFARVGITLPSEDLRRRAALDMAETIATRLEHPPMLADARQFALPL